MNQNSSHTLKDSLKSPSASDISHNDEASQGCHDFPTDQLPATNNIQDSGKNDTTNVQEKESNMQTLTQTEQPVLLIEDNLNQQEGGQLTNLSKTKPDLSQDNQYYEEVKDPYQADSIDENSEENSNQNSDQNVGKNLQQSLTEIADIQNQVREDQKFPDVSSQLQQPMSNLSALSQASLILQGNALQFMPSRDQSMIGTQFSGQFATCPQPSQNKVPFSQSESFQQNFNKQGLNHLFSQGFANDNINQGLQSFTMNTRPDQLMPQNFTLPQHIAYQGNHQHQQNTQQNFNQGRWTKQEHCRFLEALKKHGRNWRKVQQHVQTRSSTQARSHAQKFFVKIERKGQKVEEFIKQLDVTNIEDMPDEMIGFDGEDEANDSTLGSKRNTPPVSVQQLEKKEGPGFSKFKNDGASSKTQQSQIFKTFQPGSIGQISDAYSKKQTADSQQPKSLLVDALNNNMPLIQNYNSNQIAGNEQIQKSNLNKTQNQLQMQQNLQIPQNNALMSTSKQISNDNTSQSDKQLKLAQNQSNKQGFQQVNSLGTKTQQPAAQILRTQQLNQLGLGLGLTNQQGIMHPQLLGLPQGLAYAQAPLTAHSLGGLQMISAYPQQLGFQYPYMNTAQGIAPMLMNQYEDPIQQLLAAQTPIVFTQLDPNFQVNFYQNQNQFLVDQNAITPETLQNLASQGQILNQIQITATFIENILINSRKSSGAQQIKLSSKSVNSLTIAVATLSKSVIVVITDQLSIKQAKHIECPQYSRDYIQQLAGLILVTAISSAITCSTPTITALIVQLQQQHNETQQQQQLQQQQQVQQTSDDKKSQQ
eukprot:403341762